MTLLRLTHTPYDDIHPESVEIFMYKVNLCGWYYMPLNQNHFSGGRIQSEEQFGIAEVTQRTKFCM